MVTLFVQILVSLVATCVAIPVLAGSFLFKGFQRLGLEEFTLGQTIKIAFSASITAFSVVIVVGMFLPRDLAPSENLVITLSVLVAGQLIVVPLLVRRFSARVLLVEAGAVLLANLIVFAALYELREAIPR